MSYEQEASTFELSTFQLSTRPLTVGAALIGAGALVALAGWVVTGTVIASATRRWIRQLDVPPNELARQKWAQARAATTAGASAWQDGLPADTLRS
jgi:hypothetical protein